MTNPINNSSDQGFDQKNFSNDGYYLKESSKGVPGVIIDNHQGKHSSWRNSHKGGKGSRFTNLSVGEVVTLAKVIVRNVELFNAMPEGVPSTVKWNFEKRDFAQGVEREVYNKIKTASAIGISAGPGAVPNTWEMHFYPA